jgi:5-dehydro-4-deoxyglucarate dehydratase
MRPEELCGKLRDVIAFPVTPVQSDLSLGILGLRKNLRAPLEHPASAVAADTGEMYSLASEEHQEVVKAVVEEVHGRVPVIAGTGFNTRITVELAQQSARAGADAILVLPPYYPHADENSLVGYYAAIGRSTPLGLFVYSWDWVNPGPEWVVHLTETIPTLFWWKDG